jgi:peptide/nickel transport system permease protein
VPITENLVGNFRAVLLPAFTLSLLGIGLIMATARQATISVLGQDFITAALARGKRPSEIVRHHVLRNAGIPIITVLAIYSGYLLGGTIIVENLFSIPGVGRYLITGVLNRDYPVVQAGVLLAAFFFVTLNMLADILYAVLDPRIGRRRG